MPANNPILDPRWDEVLRDCGTKEQRFPMPSLNKAIQMRQFLYKRRLAMKKEIDPATLKPPHPYYAAAERVLMSIKYTLEGSDEEHRYSTHKNMKKGEVKKVFLDIGPIESLGDVLDKAGYKNQSEELPSLD